MHFKQIINTLFIFLALSSANFLVCSTAAGSHGSGADAKQAADLKRDGLSPQAGKTPPQTPAGSKNGLNSLLKWGTVGLDAATNKSVSAFATAAAEFAKSLQGGNPENIRTISAAINKAADSIAMPGTIGFAADERTQETLKTTSANLKATTANLAKATRVTQYGAQRTTAVGVTLLAARSVMDSGLGLYNGCFLVAGIETLKPGAIKACLNQTKQCLRHAQANYELTSQCPFIKQRAKPADASMARDQSACGASGGVKKDN